MAITRIQNNQITDATIVAYAKVQAGSLTGNLFAPSVTLNSNVTINGNLFLSNTGNVTTINATNTYINDPLVVFNNGYAGSLTGYDIGILVNRNLASLGSYGSVNTFLGWVEADSAFETLATTDTGTGVTSINNAGFANFKTGNLTALTVTTGGLQAVAIGNVTPGSAAFTTGTFSSTLGVTGATTMTTATAGGLQAQAIGNVTPGTYVFTTGNIGGLQAVAIGNVTPGSGSFTTLSTTGNLTVGGNIAVTGNIVPSANVTYSLGTSANRFKDLWLSGSTIYAGGFSISEETSGNVNITTNTGNRLQILGTAANSVQATGNIVAPYHLGSMVGATATITTSANITGTGASTNSTSGALVVMGGAGVAGQIYAGGIQNTPIGGTTASTAAFTTATAGGLQAVAIGNVTPGTAVFTTATTGGLQAVAIGNVTPGTGVFTTGTFNTATTGGLQAVAIGNVTPGTAVFTTATTGGLQAVAIGNVTPGTGAFTTGTFSSTLGVTGATTMTTATTGGLQAVAIGNATPGTGAFTTLSASGITQITNATQATNTTSGALVVTGGVGIGGNLYVGGWSTLQGNVSIGGNLTVTGQSVSIGASTLSISDPIINLNTPQDLTALTTPTTSDIGLKFHYYDTSDSAAFLGRAVDSGYLEWYSRGTDVANVFVGTVYGTTKSGALILANAKTVGGGLSANTGTLQVWGDGSVNGNLFVGGAFGTSSINGTPIGNATPSTGAFTTLSASGASTLNTVTGASFQGVIGNATPAAGTFTTVTTGGLQAVAIGNVTPGTGAFTTLSAGSFQGIIGNATATTAFFTTANATNVYAATVGNVGTTLNGSGTNITGLTATNINGTVTTANVSLYDSVTAYTTNQTFYPSFSNIATTGNTTQGVSSSLTYNPSTGALSATSFNGVGTFSTATTSSTLIASGNIVAASATTSTNTTTGALVVVGGTGISGNLNVGGLLNVTGNVTFSGQQVSHDNGTITMYDSILDLHTYGNLAAWATDDGKDIGLRMHYYKGADKLAFFGWENATQTLQYLQDATETNSNITGTFGNVQFGSLFLSNATQATGTTVGTGGALYVAGGAGISGNVYHGTGAVFNNSQGAGNNFQVKGVTDTSLILARPNGTYDSVIIGGTSVAATNGAKLVINSNDTMILPVGTNAQRPTAAGTGTDTTGMFRYSTTAGAIEWYNGSSWASASTSFTVIADQQFTGTGSQTIFTLSSSQTTASCIVSINGVVQIPTLAYAVTSGTTLTFTEAPAAGEVIDVRMLTTTSTVIGLSDTSGYNTVNVVTGTGVTFTSGTTAQTTQYTIDTRGAMVTNGSNVTVATASTATIDTLFANTYSSAKYTITATLQGTNIREINEVLLVHNGDASSAGTVTVLSYGKINTAGNTLVTFGATASGNIAVLQATTTNANTIFRIQKDYLAL